MLNCRKMRLSPVWLLSFVLLIALISVLFSAHGKAVQLTNNIAGTYLEGTEQMDAEYFVLDNESKYTIYQQFALIEKGTYEQEERNSRHYLLKDEKGTLRGEVLLYGEDLYYLKKGSAQLIDFKKFSNEAIFINLTDREE